ncbi:MAG: hypothetical protein HFJ20_02190 [Clostridia bacterium]|nr:hypothetical protein [Clostridia bacterium]
MIPMEHPWTEWQEEDKNSIDLYAWKWKKNTPKEIKKQYEDWEEYSNKKQHLQ